MLTTHPQWRWPDEPISVIHDHHGPGLLTTRGAFYGYNAQRTYEPDARAACRPDLTKPGTRAAVLHANGPEVDPTRGRWLCGVIGFHALILEHLNLRADLAAVKEAR